VKLLELESTDNLCLSTFDITTIRSSSEAKTTALLNKCSEAFRITEHEGISFVYNDQLSYSWFETTVHVVLYLIFSYIKEKPQVIKISPVSLQEMVIFKGEMDLGEHPNNESNSSSESSNSRLALP
jgi:hypothetical protein